MKRSNALHRGRIDWETIKEPDFNRVIEALLRRIYDKPPCTVDVVRGAGGDKGIDVVVWNEKREARIIFQLKHFLGGASGAHVRRRDQIKKSFNRAWDNYQPHQWILVMPPNGRIEEHEYIQKLALGKEVAVTIWGQSAFDDELAIHDDIERACLRNEVQDLLIEMAHEKAALVGSDDLSNRVVGLSEIAEGRSLYWRTNFSHYNGEYIETYTEKHPDAMKVEPIRTQVSFNFSDRDQDIADRVKDTLDWGSFDAIDLPARAATFERSGPEWVKPFPNLNGPLSIVAPRATVDLGETATFNFIDEAGYSQGRFDGKIAGRTGGRKGTSVRMNFANIVDVTIRRPHDTASEGGGLQVSYDMFGASVYDGARAMALQAALRPDGVMEVFHNGRLAQKVQLHSSNSDDRLEDPYTEELLDDLSALQEHLRTSFTVPRTMTNRDRAMIRVGRLLLDGYLTVMPLGTDLTATLSGEYSDQLLQFIRDGGSFASRPDAFVLDVMGSKFNLGPTTLFHRNLEVVDGPEVIAALESENDDAIPIQMRPQGAEPVQVWLGIGTDQIPEFRPWNLSKFDSFR
ncbi:hypothetical protein IWX64_002651 [Arthrobacter sp. CAN_A212]|uniref:hypothetical protein n=1 Tax=Arthrobacter sp. CAN_A212 TaxID=2787719 RepID=UPI0018CAD58D